MDEFESETEKLLPNISVTHTDKDLDEVYLKLNRNDQSSSEYDNEDDENISDTDDDSLENDELKSLSSDEGINNKKGEAPKPQHQRKYSKDMTLVNSSERLSEIKFSEAIESQKEIDIIVSECHLHDNNVAEKDITDLAGIFPKNEIEVPDERQRPLVTNTDNDNYTVNTNFSSSDDLSGIQSTEYKEARQKFVVDQKCTLKTSETILPHFSPTDYTEGQELDCIGGVKYGSETNFISDNTKDVTHSVSKGSKSICWIKQSLELDFEEAADQLHELVLGNHKCQDSTDILKDTNNTDPKGNIQRQAYTANIKILTDAPDVVNRSQVLNLSDGLNHHKQMTLKYDDHEDYACGSNNINNSVDLNCVDKQNNMDDGQMMSSPDNPKISSKFEFENMSIGGNKNALEYAKSQTFIEDDEFNEHVCSHVHLSDPNNLKYLKEQLTPDEIQLSRCIKNNIPTRKKYFDFSSCDFATLSVNAQDPINTENITDCGTLSVNGDFLNQPGAKSVKFESCDSISSNEIKASREDKSGYKQCLQYDQVVSESLHNQLNRFDLLIDTIDQRNAINLATNAADRGYWSTIFGQASEIEAYDEISPERSKYYFIYLYICLFI